MDLDEWQVFIKIYNRFWVGKIGGRRMNLLTDKWIPVRDGADFKQISYKELLCKEQPGLQVALPRDDLELACIQMLAAMTQVIFMPEDKIKLRTKIKTPLSEGDFDEGIKKYLDWFDLDHEKWPFMQVSNLKIKDPTPIQKLFPGLPAGNNHAFFNEKDEFKKVCKSCAAIGLFNLCTHTPNISGKHKGSLRGNAPISTMVYDSILRKMIWMNVLSMEMVMRVFIGERIEEPVWVRNITQNDKILSNNIGITRGLFWTPILVQLISQEEEIVCDCCGLRSNIQISEFHLGSDFKFEITGLWPHPYSPRQLNILKEEKKGKEKPDETIVSFRSSEPAWTQFSELLYQRDRTDKKEGYIPAAVVTQYNTLSNCEPLHLIIGGYRNKQAAILQRRHELYSLPAGWNEDFRDRIDEIIGIGLEAEDILSKKVLYPAVKGQKEKGLKGIGTNINSQSSAIYFHLTEPIIHGMLRETTLKEYVTAKNKFIESISDICLEIFERVTLPYVHKPELMGTIALAHNKLEKLLNKLKKDHSTTGGAA
jgi:CRISPR system Cascade subunit CasA